MAQNDTENTLGFVDKRRATRAGSNALSVGTDANFTDVAGLRARLFAAAPSSYSQARLETMTKNDMQYALRLLDEAGSI